MSGRSRLICAACGCGGDVSFEFPSTTPLLPPGQHVVLVENAAVFASRFGNDLKVSGEFSGRLPAGEGEVRLVSSALALLEAVHYRSDSPWPEGLNGEGFSLTRIAPARRLPADQPASWRISRAVGGSPGTSDSLDYFTWKADHNIISDDDDRDADGLNTLMEYAFGGDPQLPDAALASTIQAVETTAGLSVLLAANRRVGADDVTLTIENSTDLETWLTASPMLTRQHRSPGDHITQEYDLGPITVGASAAWRCRVSIGP